MPAAASSGGSGQVVDDAVDLGAGEPGELPLVGLDVKFGLLEVADDQDLLQALNVRLNTAHLLRRSGPVPSTDRERAAFHDG